MTCHRCRRIAKDLRPEPWFGDRALYDIFAIGLPCLFMAALTIGLVLL